MPLLVRALAVTCLAGLLTACPSSSSSSSSPDGEADPRPVGGEVSKDALQEPNLATLRAPDTYEAEFETSQGSFVIEVHRDWAPLGADRFYNLVKAGFFDGARFFRVIKGFMAQFGLNGDPAVNAAWRKAKIDDDPGTQSNTRGMVTFATAGPNTRTTQVFINFADNTNLDSMGFTPFGKVTDGMDVVDKLYAEYGECYPRGSGPDQARMQIEGNAYLQESFPKLDYVKQATIDE